MFEVFDEPDLNVTCERRAVSTVPTQALTLLNNEFTLMQANFLATACWKEAARIRPKRIKEMYRIALSREPNRGGIASTILAFLQEAAEARCHRGGSGDGAARLGGDDRFGSRDAESERIRVYQVGEQVIMFEQNARTKPRSDMFPGGNSGWKREWESADWP